MWKTRSFPLWNPHATSGWLGWHATESTISLGASNSYLQTVIAVVLAALPLGWVF